MLNAYSLVNSHGVYEGQRAVAPDQRVFILFSDGYEKGAFARIPVRWDDVTATLAIGKREGSFPGMLASRTFDVVLVTKGKPVGFSFEPKPDRTVRYDGAAVAVELRSLSR